MPDSDSKNLVFSGAFAKTCQIKSYDIGPESRLTVPAALRYLHDVAQDHASFYNFGYADLQKQGLAWALVSLDLSMQPLPYGQESIDISTSVAAYGGPVVYRDYFMRFGESTILEGQSMWVLIDLETRKSAAMPRELKDVLRTIEHPLQDSVRRVGRLKPLPDTKISSTRHQVAYHDCDFNGHLNNVISVRWMLDALFLDQPDLKRDVTRLCVTYFHEALEGEFATVAIQGKGAELMLDNGNIAVRLELN